MVGVTGHEYRLRDAEGFVVTGTITRDAAESRIAYLLQHDLRVPPFTIEHREVTEWEPLR